MTDSTAQHPSRWMANVQLFSSELREGHRWAEMIGRRLEECGYPVRVTPLKLRDSIAEIPEYEDEFDIVVGEDGGPQFVVESKSRRLGFSEDPSSYPYPTAFVDTCSGWDAKVTKPRAIVLVSQLTGAMLVIPVRQSRPRWTVTRTYDRVRGIRDNWYLVPAADLMPMQTLLDWLASGRWQTEGL